MAASVSRMRILLVEDEPHAAHVLAKGLREQTYAVDVAADGETAIFQIGTTDYDALILDVMLPRIDGLAVCRTIRESGNAVPILMLTARDAVDDRVIGLDSGADDYLTKPFSFDELLARLRAALRRATSTGEPVLEVGDLRLDLEKRSASFAGQHLTLTPHEFTLLRVFMQNEGKLLTHRAILREVWGPAYGDESNYLHVYVSQLRRKIEPDPARPRYLLTEPGAGYRLVGPEPS